jgi:3-oxoacyl-[acyl-carrier-protein] synthase-1
MSDYKRKVYIVSDNIISSLGFTTAENFSNLKNNQTGIRIQDDPLLYPSPVPVSRIDTAELDRRVEDLTGLYGKSSQISSYTRMEKFFLLSIHEALLNSTIDLHSKRLLLVLSTTKGNIDLLEDRYKAVFSHKRLYLWELARVVASFFGLVNTPVIVSNACISGVMAIMMAKRFIQSGLYDQAIVTGGDIASEFVISGFQSFLALSPEPCKPFDLNRTGLSLGEGCGTMILSAEPPASGAEVIVAGNATSNDANHISGPSRTGEELSAAINNAIAGAGLTPSGIHYISAHGTATPYNDEMESKAIALSGLASVPLNSFKGYWGHTLGAAGIIESVAAIHSLHEDLLIRSAGFETLGVPEPLNVISVHKQAMLKTCLKTASGFGGCNAAIVYQKL